MIRLEDLQPNATARGLLPDCLVTVVSVQWFGSEALELTYKTPAGRVANELLYRHDEPRLDLVEQGRPWSFDGDGALFRLVSEAHRIRLAHLFDPVLALHTSIVDPLPHQITAVYETHFKRFLMIIRSAGFVDSSLIGSQNALNFSYILYLTLRQQGIPDADNILFNKEYF